MKEKIICKRKKFFVIISRIGNNKINIFGIIRNISFKLSFALSIFLNTENSNDIEILNIHIINLYSHNK